MKAGKKILWIVGVGCALGALAGVGVSVAKSYHLSGPHTLSSSRALLSPAMTEQVIAAAQPQPRKMSEAIERALAITDKALSPGEGTPMAERVDEKGFPRELRVDLDGAPGTSEDYAHTFARVLEKLLVELEINHRIYVVNSAARSLADRDLGPHSWVYVQEHRKNVWLGHYVDPALHDRTGRWNILGHVEEPVPVPKPGE